MKILFICKDNQYRSVKAEKVCKSLVKRKGLDYEISSAGLSVQSETLATPHLLAEYDVLVVMEESMKSKLTVKDKPIYVRDISEEVSQKNLKKDLISKITKILDELPKEKR